MSTVGREAAPDLLQLAVRLLITTGELVRVAAEASLEE